MPSKLRPFEISRTGSAVLLGAVVLYVAGVAFGYEQLVVIAAGGLLVLVVAIGFVSVRPKVRVTREFQPSSVVAGQSAAAVMGVTNLSSLPSPTFRVADRVGNRDIELPIRVLRAGGTALVQYPLPTERRGRVGLGPLRIVRTDPFDLLRRRSPAGGLDVLWVHPRTWPLSPLPAGVIVDFEGPISETGTEGSLTFSSLREYVAGDDRRQIHWRSSARAGVLMVRRNVDANEPRATVVLDTRSSVWAGDTFEDGVEVAASAIRALAGMGHPVDLRILGERGQDPRYEGAITPSDRLAAVEVDPDATATGLYSLLQSAQEGGSLVVVTGRVDVAIEAQLTNENQRYAPIVLCCVDPARSPHWQRRSGVSVVMGRSAPAVAEAWNELFGH
ncbi:MAG: DUF58 domain-containing protein [Acidimicrobiaceae bacterium]|nr:DUF58 domain-containing protein [Acidimicrobiaceae bacterium]